MNIKQLKDLALKATPGSWDCYRSTTDSGEWVMGIEMHKGKDLPDYHWISTDREAGSEWDNAEFISAANPEMVLKLIEVIESFKETIIFYSQLESKHLLNLNSPAKKVLEKHKKN